jgi:hypothetical protein
LLDLQQLGRLKLLEVGSNAAVGRPHVLRQLDLPREAGVVLPSVLKQHGVRELGAHRYDRIRQDEIRDLRKAVARRKVGADDLDVAFFVFEDVADVASLRVFHQDHYTRRANRYPLLIHVLNEALVAPKPNYFRGAARRDRSRLRQAILVRERERTL